MGAKPSSEVLAAERRKQRLEQNKVMRAMQQHADQVATRGAELSQQVLASVKSGDLTRVRALALQLARNQALQTRIAASIAQFETFASQVQEVELSQRVAESINAMTQRMVAFSRYSSLADTHEAMRNFALESHDMQLRSGMLEAALSSQQCEGEADAHLDATAIANQVLEQLGAELRLPDEASARLELSTAPRSSVDAAPLFADTT